MTNTTITISPDFKTVYDERIGVALPLSPLLAASLDLPDDPPGTHALVRAHIQFMQDDLAYRAARKAADEALEAAQEASAKVPQQHEELMQQARATSDVTTLERIRVAHEEIVERALALLQAAQDAHAAAAEAWKTAKQTHDLCEAMSEARDAKETGKLAA